MTGESNVICLCCVSPTSASLYRWHSTLCTQLLEVLDRGDLTSIIDWMPHGRAFVVKQPEVFTAQVLSRFFRQTKFMSFIRQLNLWGFKRITSGRDAGAYYNQLFLPMGDVLATRMSRIKVKGNGIRPLPNPDQEPDFYSCYPPVHKAPRTVAPLPLLRNERMAGMSHAEYAATSTETIKLYGQSSLAPKCPPSMGAGLGIQQNAPAFSYPMNAAAAAEARIQDLFRSGLTSSSFLPGSLPKFAGLGIQEETDHIIGASSSLLGLSAHSGSGLGIQGELTPSHIAPSSMLGLSAHSNHISGSSSAMLGLSAHSGPGIGIQGQYCLSHIAPSSLRVLSAHSGSGLGVQGVATSGLDSSSSMLGLSARRGSGLGIQGEASSMIGLSTHSGSAFPLEPSFVPPILDLHHASSALSHHQYNNTILAPLKSSSHVNDAEHVVAAANRRLMERLLNQTEIAPLGKVVTALPPFQVRPTQDGNDALVSSPTASTFSPLRRESLKRPISPTTQCGRSRTYTPASKDANLRDFNDAVLGMEYLEELARRQRTRLRAMTGAMHVHQSVGVSAEDSLSLCGKITG